MYFVKFESDFDIMVICTAFSCGISQKIGTKRPVVHRVSETSYIVDVLLFFTPWCSRRRPDGRGRGGRVHHAER